MGPSKLLKVFRYCVVENLHSSGQFWTFYMIPILCLVTKHGLSLDHLPPLFLYTQLSNDPKRGQAVDQSENISINLINPLQWLSGHGVDVPLHAQHILAIVLHLISLVVYYFAGKIYRANPLSLLEIQTRKKRESNHSGVKS